MSIFLLGLIAFIIISLVLVIVQIFLSLSKSKILGLIIPVISLTIGGFIPLLPILLENSSYKQMVNVEIFTMFLFVGSSLVYFLIYGICKLIIHSRNKNELQRMNVQDLD